MAYDIRNVKTITDLISYFSQNIGWNIDIDDFDDIEDISYDFDAEDIGLKEESFARISSLRQLQPLVDGQQWGIFCVEFDSKNKYWTDRYSMGGIEEPPLKQGPNDNDAINFAKEDTQKAIDNK